MPTFGYQSPNKGNALAKDAFRVFGSGLPAGVQINWSLNFSGQIAGSLSGTVTADANGNLDQTISDPSIEAYVSNPSLPQLLGGAASGDGTSFNVSASDGTQIIELSAQLAFS